MTADSAKRTCKGLRKGGRERWLWSALIADWAEMREENLTKQQPCKVEGGEWRKLRVSEEKRGVGVCEKGSTKKGVAGSRAPGAYLCGGRGG